MRGRAFGQLVQKSPSHSRSIRPPHSHLTVLDRGGLSHYLLSHLTAAGDFARVRLVGSYER